MSHKRINRRKQREIAFQVLFQQEINSTSDEFALLQLALQCQLDQEDAVAIEFHTVAEMMNSFPELAYSQELIAGVQKNRAAIDHLIEQYATDRKLNRVIRMDLILLRIAVYEMKFNEQEVVPGAVALNEALEIAKIYSDGKSTAFINGILSNLIED